MIASDVRSNISGEKEKSELKFFIIIHIEKLFC